MHELESGKDFFVRQDLQDWIDCLTSAFPPARHQLRFRRCQAGMKGRRVNPAAREINHFASLGWRYLRLTSTPDGPKLIRRPISFFIPLR